MKQEKSKSLPYFAALFVALGLAISGCEENAGGADGAPAEDGMSMDDAEDTIKDGIDPETGNPPEL